MAKAVKSRKSKSYPIVGIGASAGGLEAVTELLKNLPSDTGMAFVYVQHLDPSHKSMLSEILQRSTEMKVTEAKHLLKIQPNHVFVIPPNKHMEIIDGVLTLNPRNPKPEVQMSIDKFFSSLAEKQKESAIGIILSGNAHDGTFGLKAIKHAGGITFAQDDTAKFPSMPKSAIAEGVVDMVLPPSVIAKELERISRHPVIRLEKLQEKPEDEIDDADKDLNSIIQLLKKATGVDFFHYKMNTVKRRIIKRMFLHKLETLSEYFRHLKIHNGEISVLYQDMLINVTTFFRDPDMIEYLRKSILPRIFNDKSANDVVRVWIPACSTGEEAYSLAIIIMEHLSEMNHLVQVQIFATDLSDNSIAKARLGLYAPQDLENISPKRLQQFFEKIDGSYRVVKSIRDLCVFATHNVFKDPPFSRIDLISCCNLLIYVDNVLQKKVISLFHYALKNTGLLILGKSETIGTSTTLFSQLEKKYKVYSKKKSDQANVSFDVHYQVLESDRALKNVPMSSSRPLKKMPEAVSDLENEVDNILMEQFVPASVVVNENMEIQHFRGSTSLYLEPSQGKASLHLMKMARPGLGFELRNVINKVIKTGERTKRTGLPVKVKDIVHNVSIEVLPLPNNEDEKLFLIVFSESSTYASAPAKSLPKDKLLKQLQEELANAKEDMRSILEEQEASVEELQSANEEIVSSNEELQSINEELETSKEEVESSNEELLTINSELQIRNEQLAESYEYAEMMFDTIQEAVLILDREFRVKKANRAFYRIFHTSQQQTENSLLFELGNRQWSILELRELLGKLVEHNIEFDGYEIRHRFPSIGEKVMLVKGRKIVQDIHGTQLIIVTIIDISEHRRAEKVIAERESWFRNMSNNVPVMIWASGRDKLWTFFNNTWLKFTDRTIEQEKNYGWLDGVHKEDRGTVLEAYNRSFENITAFNIEFRLRRHDDEYRWVLMSGEPAYSLEGVREGYTGFCTEIHDTKLMFSELENRVKSRTAQLNDVVNDLEQTNVELNQFAYVTSHDLQEPLRKIITFSDRLLDSGNQFDVQAREYISRIISSAERMRKLILDLLEFSKSTRSNQDFVSTDLNLLLKDVIKDLELLMEEKKAQVSADKLPVIKAIPVQIRQLFYNLLNNALKFSRAGVNPIINISVRNLKPGELQEYSMLDWKRAYFEIVFSDNGIGFKAEYAEQIFTIFQRLNNTPAYSGSGIGLALCRKIVINHRGLIYARSKDSKGSEFFVVLPYE